MPGSPCSKRSQLTISRSVSKVRSVVELRVSGIFCNYTENYFCMRQRLCGLKLRKKRDGFWCWATLKKINWYWRLQTNLAWIIRHNFGARSLPLILRNCLSQGRQIALSTSFRCHRLPGWSAASHPENKKNWILATPNDVRTRVEENPETSVCL